MTNQISNSKYTQPQFINNFILEKNDPAFNAHPINKEIIIKTKNNEEQKSPEKKGEKKKNKKGKVMKCNAQTETNLFDGVDIPINKVDYHKKNVKKKNVKKNNNFNRMNYNQNKQMLINNMYNKYQSDSKYKFPEYELRPINYNNNNNNYPNKNNFNNYYNNQNINYETKSNQQNDDNNTYLKFLTNLKSQINDYTNNLVNDKKILQKVKEERNIYQQYDQNNLEVNKNNNINNDNDNVNKEIKDNQ